MPFLHGHKFFKPLGKFQGVKLFDHMSDGILYWLVSKTFKGVPIVLHNYKTDMLPYEFWNNVGKNTISLVGYKRGGEVPSEEASLCFL